MIFNSKFVWITVSVISMLLTACGAQPNRLLMNDQEAALTAQGTLEGSATQIDTTPIAPLSQNPAQTSKEQNVNSPHLPLFQYDNVQISANFDTQTVKATFDLQLNFLSSTPKTSIVLEGRIQSDGINKGFANLKATSAKKSDGTDIALPPILGQARCIQQCENLVLDLIVRDQNGKLKTTQFELVNQNKKNETPPSTFFTPPNTPVQTQNTSLNESDDFNEDDDFESTQNTNLTSDIDEEFDDAGFDAVPGGYSAPIIQEEDATTINKPLTDYISSNLSAEEKKTYEETKKTTPIEVQKTDIETTEEDEESVVVYNPKKDQEILFPYQLGNDYQGKSANFYYSYCSIQQGSITPARRDSGNNTCTKNKKTIYDGSLSTASELPAQAPGFESVQRQDQRFYGSGLLVKYLLEAGKLFAEKFPNFFIQVNDTSSQFGGPIWRNQNKLAHAAHQNGLEADILLLKDAKGKFDIEKNWETLKIFSDLGYVHMIYTDRARIKEFCSYSKQKKDTSGKTEFERYNEILRRLQHWAGHRTHLHLRLKCTPHNPSCRKDRVDPILSKPQC